MLKTKAIVIKEVDYRDNDKMLTLFSPIFGKVDALSRGCKKPSSKLLACSQLFVSGEYQFSISKNKHYLAGCEISHTFFDLRKDYNKLFLSQFYLEVVGAYILHEQPENALYYLLINCLYALENNLNHADTITLFFITKCCDALGIRPQLQSCAHCGDKKQFSYLNIEAGGVVCDTCLKQVNGKKYRLSEQDIAFILSFLSSPSKQIRVKTQIIASKRLIDVFMEYLEQNTSARFKGYRTISQL